jgi:hypothetical protein
LAGQPRLDKGSKENAYLDLAHRTFTLLGHMLCCITESRSACHRKIRHKVASHALLIELNIVGFTLISLFSDVLYIFIQCDNRKIYFLVLRGIYSDAFDGDNKRSSRILSKAWEGLSNPTAATGWIDVGQGHGL